ncbi:ATP-binding protein [Streptomyces sp. H27-D2]|uniref:ATP-binding protein n=1 Tax=Streptomyces sp. H27-D2 TaxID=3046304 RepID=UPI002DBB3121|nr:ATP-binding protein [Streptomyces sp. H27-D2]MEC4017226.1 ATP-binding protein [Streptomyces sp. H27-D2]
MHCEINTPDHYRLHLPTVGADSPTQVRRIVRAHLRFWGLAELADAAGLCVTELLSNVIRHVDDRRCTLELWRRGDDGVRVEVHDSEPELPLIRVTGDVLSESGRGLVLLAAIAHAWDAERTGGGKVVWFELKQS